MQVKIYRRNISRIFIHMSVYQKATFQKFISDSRPHTSAFVDNFGQGKTRFRFDLVGKFW